PRPVPAPPVQRPAETETGARKRRHRRERPGNHRRGCAVLTIEGDYGMTIITTGLSRNCLRTRRCPRPCSKCGVPLAGSVAHLPLYAAGIFCSTCCPSCKTPTPKEKAA